jgi:hypothetical protein
MDPTNPVVQLCVQGMQAEGEGRNDDARALFARAWAERKDDFDACIAAHYLARHQPTPEAILEWNQLALNHADAVGDDRVQAFYPSLYLNLGHAHEVLGDRETALGCCELAEEWIARLPDDRYGDVVRHGLKELRRRLGP